MYARRAAAVALALLAWLLPRQADAWQELHQTGTDVTVRVEPNGVAAVELRLRWHVVHGPLKSIDVAKVDSGAAIEPDVGIAADDGRKLTAHAVRVDDKTVRVAIDDPHALMRGTFTFDLRWHIDLNTAGALVRDGAMWRLAWSAPASTDGVDGARMILDLPAAPAPPLPLAAETDAIDESAASSLRRERERDVLEWVIPHVARGESATWNVRVDPRALSQVRDPRLRPPPDVKPPQEPDRVREVSLAAMLGALAIAFGWLVRHKVGAFRAQCEARSARARGLLPLGDRTRAGLAGAGLAAGVGLQIYGSPTVGAACLAVAMFAASSCAPVAKTVARGPGRWLALRYEDAFAKPPLRVAVSWLDLGARQGRVVALSCAVLVAALAVAANRFDRVGAWLALLDAVALVPLFVTGLSSQLPPSCGGGGRSAAPWLARMFHRLSADETLRVSPWARIAEGEGAPKAPSPGHSLAPAVRAAVDELRLLVFPRAAMPGVVGIEIGLAWSHTPVGWTARPEVLARVLDGSPAAAKLACEILPARLVAGRRVDERVAVLLPRAPNRACTVALVQATAGALSDRRLTLPVRVWTATERRTSLVSTNSGANRVAAGASPSGAAKAA